MADTGITREDKCVFAISVVRAIIMGVTATDDTVATIVTTATGEMTTMITTIMDVIMAEAADMEKVIGKLSSA
jgi:hypothetical protein